MHRDPPRPRPRRLTDAVAEAVSAELANVVIGNPADKSVRMGALASLDQREEVRRSLKALEDAARVVFGDPEHVEVQGADAERGAFLSPILLGANDARRPEVHEVEAFGPVSTLIGYRDTADVIDLAGLGKGSLAGSIVTDDPEFAREVVLGTAPWHGRLLVLDDDAAPESTGHGSPLPMLVHGGPGRAGGGEEMGGMRGVYHHMQRTAIQASPRMLQAATGRWVKGAPRNLDDAHPFTKPLSPAAHRRHHPRRPAHRHPRRHRALRRVHRGHVLRPHGRGSRREEPVLRRPRRPRLPDRVPRRRPVRPARLRARARELRHRQPPVPDPGQARRRDDA